MKTTLVPIILLLMSAFTQAEWKPPEKPDPKKILREATEDAEAERYEDALAKHVWFHRNALEHQPSQYGVRLSFALTEWQRLGEVYPPALEKMKAIRDEYAQALRGESRDREVFHDFESINEQLGEHEKTAELFRWLDANKPDVAKGVSDLAQPALIQGKEYVLAGKYLHPKEDYERLLLRYQETKDLAKKPEYGERLKVHAEKSFSNGISTLVALLVKNGRKAEAEEIAKKASAEQNTPEFQEELKSALAGTVPEPWP